MPELPEVETIKKQLNIALEGKIIKAVKILSKKQFPQSAKLVVGEKILKVERRAKVLILRLTHHKNLLVHLKLSGQLIWSSRAPKDSIKLQRNISTIGQSLPTKSTRVILDIGRGRLFFNEMRKFGWMKLLNDEQLEKELNRYGIEPLSDSFRLGELGKICSKTSRAIKLVLLDQEKIAGIGNIYANESLYLSKISPKLPANSLTRNQLIGLRKNIIKVLKLGLKYGGASDEYYLHPDLTIGSYQKHFLVYGEQGKKCRRCKTMIKRISLGGRGTFYCPKCQK
jgi:formamidopyrimidine-DNA glycosylase